MKRWMIVGFAAGAALFGYPPVLVAATQADPGEDDWVLDVERYANSRAGSGTSLPAGGRPSRPGGRRSRRR
jgi:hypothetical protein